MYWIFVVLILLILTSCSVPSKEGAADYAWVLVDTIDYGASEEDLERERRDALAFNFGLEASVLQGNFSIRIYEKRLYNKGETGIAHSSQASFSTPPNTIRAGETVTLSISLFVTEATGRWDKQAYAFFDSMPFWPKHIDSSAGSVSIETFKNKNGEMFFEVLDRDVLSLNETFSATALSGAQKGDKIAIHMIYDAHHFKLGTRYIYEWKAQ